MDLLNVGGLRLKTMRVNIEFLIIGLARTQLWE